VYFEIIKDEYSYFDQSRFSAITIALKLECHERERCVRKFE